MCVPGVPCRQEFASLYDEVHKSDPPTPVKCLLQSAPPRSPVGLLMFDYARAVWKKVTTLGGEAYPRTGRVYMNEDCHHAYAVGRLVCFRYKGDDVRAWVVWNPLTGKWKTLPPSKYDAGVGAIAFMYAFEAGDESPSKSYKILVAHAPREVIDDTSPSFHFGGDCDGSLVAEIYDSATGSWTDPAPECIFQRPMISFNPNSFGEPVLCDGVIYFTASKRMRADNFTASKRMRADNFTGAVDQKVLLCYDIKSGEWHEQETDNHCSCIFEWDGRVMAVMPAQLAQLHGEGDCFIWIDFRTTALYEVCCWDPASKRWVNTGVHIPNRIMENFDDRIMENFDVALGSFAKWVAAGDYLVSTGICPLYKDGIWTAVYNKQENNWRYVEDVSISTSPFRQMLQYKPRLDLVL
ncbi:hypothetical protein KC19_2G155400 [Ceratodon purpureus]|uniref:F-box associated beta-propeller type 1 domain-containing protein n=1 Tax=Ceratodon purpureus TaxID=3225 RepID=A0A8T0IWX2_CERPU|nr:hypothetical protein KC19_2G155400 [Ceratodon purpureus]